MYEKGHLKLEELARRRDTLSQVNDALEALARGDGGRGVVFPAT